MDTINISEIGVVALSQTEEYDITGGWSWEECLGAAVVTGVTSGFISAAVSGGTLAPVAFVAGAFGGVLGYTGMEIWNHFFDE